VRHIGLALALIPARAAQFGSIGDTVLCDFNRDGAQQTGELGLAGVKVTLTGNNMTQTAVADANGNYLFGHHEAGDYTVTVDPARALPQLQCYSAKLSVDFRHPT